MKVFRTSIVIENSDEWPIAMVEVKALSGLTLEVARINMCNHQNRS